MNRIPLFTVICCQVALLAVAGAAPAGVRPPTPKEQALLTGEQVAKLREYSLTVADKLIAYNEKEVAHIKARKKPFPGDAETLKKFQMSTDYAKAYKERLAARQEILDYQEKCRKEKITGEEAVQKLVDLDKSVQEANQKMKELATAYKATWKLDIPDPYQLVIEKLFQSEPLK